jgi:hypothetical protein
LSSKQPNFQKRRFSKKLDIRTGRQMDLDERTYSNQAMAVARPARRSVFPLPRAKS